MVVARPLSRQVLTDQVKERLLEDILAGRYLPDARIVETAVARELGTSQGPVREALRALEAIGVVEITPFRGARVRRPSRREVVEAYAVRSTLEALGARTAVPRLTDADLVVLAGLLAEMRTAASTGDGHAVAAADARFHAHLMDVADNGTLAGVWASLEPTSRTYPRSWARARTCPGRPSCMPRSWRRWCGATRRPSSRRCRVTSTRFVT
jgi:DNA-binding GntR family transcriptional regulator